MPSAFGAVPNEQAHSGGKVREGDACSHDHAVNRAAPSFPAVIMSILIMAILIMILIIIIIIIMLQHAVSRAATTRRGTIASKEGGLGESVRARTGQSVGGSTCPHTRKEVQGCGTLLVSEIRERRDAGEAAGQLGEGGRAQLVALGL